MDIVKNKERCMSSKKLTSKEIKKKINKKCDHLWDVLSKTPLSEEIKGFTKTERKCRRCKEVNFLLEKKK